MGAAAIVFGATFVGLNPDREVVILTLPGHRSIEVRDAVVILAGGHSIHVRDALGALLVLAGIVALWRTSVWHGITGVVPIVAGTLLIETGSGRYDPIFVTLPRGGHGLHVTDALGMAIVLVGVLALWRAPPRRRSDLRE